MLSGKAKSTVSILANAKTVVLAALFFQLALVGCGKDSGLKSMGAFELAERQASCLDRAPTAPGSVQACKNIARECQRRKEELGQYVCRSQ